MAEDNYNTSQSNLNADLQQQQQQQPLQGQLRRQRSQQSSEQLAPGAAPRTTRIADEMSQDLQYLSREAPLDGGESTFGAYSTLGGGGSQQQHPATSGNGATTVVHQTAYKSTTTTRTSTGSPLGDEDPGLLLEDELNDTDDQRQHTRPTESDYERTDFRIDGDDDATQVYDYNQQMATAGGGRDTQSPFGDPQQHQQQLEQLAPDNVDIQRPLQQAG